MSETAEKNNKIDIFENKPIPIALATMAIPTITSQLITLIYNMADTWYIGQTDNPYMVAACSLVATVFMMTIVVANLFGTGGGSLAVRLLGSKDEEEAKKVASYSLFMSAISALTFSILCFVFMEPLLNLLGASENTMEYAKQYLFFVVVLGGVPTILSNTMSTLLRNVGYAREAAFGLGMGGVLNVILDPIFMFVILPDGFEVMGAAIATMLSNLIAFIYYIWMYKRVEKNTILEIPKGLVKIRKDSMKSIFAVGIPTALTILLFDVTNIIINRLASAYGDISLAAIGIVFKVERLPLNTGIGICLGMAPLISYNYAAKNLKRMDQFFKAARIAGLAVALICVVLYRVGAPYIIRAFIADPETVTLGTAFLQARCFATPMMFLSFHMVHFTSALGKGKYSLMLAVIRQLCLNIPIVFILNHFFGMYGIIWTQAVADTLNVVASYVIYGRIKKEIHLV